MASSRLEKIGTIYTRVTGLLRSGALKEEDIPIWYAVYKAFPPKYEPKFDRPAPKKTVPSIFYLEDEIRAQFHKNSKFTGTINLSDTSSLTQTQKFISIYKQLQEEGNTKEEELFSSAMELFNAEGLGTRQKQTMTESMQDNVIEDKKNAHTMASSLKEAQKEKSSRLDINVKDIFKE